MATDTLLGWIGGLFVGAAFLLLGRGIGNAVARCWRSILLHLLGCGASLLVGIVAMPVLAVAIVGHSDSGPPENKVRILAECISEAMNCGAWLALPALMIGYWLSRIDASKNAL